MKISSLYHGFALQHEALIKEIVKRVTAAVPVHRLYLLGLTTTCRRIESLFSCPSATQHRVSHFYLLALVDSDTGLSAVAVQDKIENKLQPFIPVTVVVLAVKQFADWVKTGHPFARAVVTYPFLLLDSGKNELPLPGEPDAEALRRHYALQFAIAHNRVDAFLTGARLLHDQRHLELAAFLLHQAAEQALSCMLQICTGLRVVTHNLYKLVRYCSLFCYQLPSVLSRDSAAEAQVLHLLQSAYLDSRYRSEFTVSEEELNSLFGKVERVYGLFREYCEPVVSTNGSFPNPAGS